MHARARRNLIIIGVVMLVAMGASTLLPLLRQNVRTQANQPEVRPTEVPIPTFPPPLENPATISFDRTYFHPSGLFSVVQPEGWVVNQENSDQDSVEVSMNNGDLQSVIHVAVLVPAEPVTGLDQVEAFYTTRTLDESWRNYRDSRETGRRRENDRLLIDFELVSFQRQTFVARQAAWTDGDWIYQVRVVTPENATDTLVYLLENVIPTVQPNKQFAGTPLDWNAYHDATTEAFIRYPSDWRLEDSAEGRLASISGSAGEVLRVEMQPETTVADDAAARAWVEANLDGAEVLSVEPVTHGESGGFAVAYRYTDIDGEGHSGLAVLLNGTDSALRVANLRFPESGVDLNSDSARESYNNLAMVMDTFMLLPVSEAAAATEEAPTS